MRILEVNGIERITRNGVLYAIIIKKDVKTEKFRVFTPDDYPLQMGISTQKKGTKLEPHFHPSIEKIFDNIPRHEVIHIKKGRARLSIYAKDRKKIKECILDEGDTALVT